MACTPRLPLEVFLAGRHEAWRNCCANKADVNAKYDDVWTPLHWTAYWPLMNR
jgi:hypothetical protein